MDTRDGRIYYEAEVDAMSEADRKYMRPMGHHPTPVQRAAMQVGRNDPCPCGSRKKFKRCCLWQQGLKQLAADRVNRLVEEVRPS